MSRKHSKQKHGGGDRETSRETGDLQRRMQNDWDQDPGDKPQNDKPLFFDGPNLPDHSEASNKNQDEGKVYDL
jgi:hypothetical protein